MRRWTTDSVHEGGSCTFTVIMKRRHDLFLLFGREDTRCFLLEFLVGFSFSSEGTGQNDTHQRSTGLLLLLLTLKYDLMQIFW
jgi:hypothetical protein